MLRSPEVWHGGARGGAERARGVARMARCKGKARRVGCMTREQASNCSLEGFCGMRGEACGGRTRSDMFDCFLFFVLYAHVAEALRVKCGR